MNGYGAKDLCKAIERELHENEREYFDFAWREKVWRALEETSRYSKLVKWLNRKIDSSGGIINVLCPAEQREDFLKSYMESMRDYAVLIHMRDLLLDSRMTEEQRKNIEYTLEKLYGVHYDEYLEDYV